MWENGSISWFLYFKVLILEPIIILLLICKIQNWCLVGGIYLNDAPMSIFAMVFYLQIFSIFRAVTLTECNTWPWNFLDSSESLNANLLIPKFWFIWLWYLSFCITYKSKSLRNKKKDKKLKLWNLLSYRKISRSQPQNSTSNVLWPQWPQKRPFETFWKTPQINAFVPKIDGRYES